MLDQELQHRCEGPIESSLEHFAELSSSGLNFAYTGMEKLQVANLVNLHPFLTIRSIVILTVA